MRNSMYKIKGFLKEQSPAILTYVGAAGVVVTSVMAARATLKASKIIEDAESEKEKTLTTKEKIKVAGPAYIPTVVVGATTIACVIGSNVLNKRKQAALISAYKMLDESFKEYKDKVEEVYGKGSDKKIREELTKDKYEDNKSANNGKQLFYDDFSKRYFESTKEDVLAAEYEINKRLSQGGGAYLNEFYELVDLPPTKSGEALGWSIGQMMDMYWDCWLEFHHEEIKMPDGRSCIAIYFTEPLPDFADY